MVLLSPFSGTLYAIPPVVRLNLVRFLSGTEGAVFIWCTGADTGEMAFEDALLSSRFIAPFGAGATRDVAEDLVNTLGVEADFEVVVFDVVLALLYVFCLCVVGVVV